MIIKFYIIKQDDELKSFKKSKFNHKKTAKNFLENLFSSYLQS